MGKDDKEDSGFGFKDAAKAKETLRLLEAHDPNYRRLTVRGLLGRAKRVLSMTKAEDKIKNIKGAMEVFEDWLAKLDKDKNTDKTPQKKKDDKHESSDDAEMEEKESKPAPSPTPDKVPGLGFKDRAAAEATVKELDGRDPEYQRLAVKGLLGSAKRVLAGTKDETKLNNIKEAVSVLEQFLDDFDSNHMAKENNAYLSLGIVRTCLNMASHATEQQKSFIAAYASVDGEYKRLRTVAAREGGKTWDIVRNTALKGLKEKHAEAKLFTDKDEPTEEHLEMLLWAYSPEAARVKKVIQETQDGGRIKDGDRKQDGGRETRKRRSSGQDDGESKRSRE